MDLLKKHILNSRMKTMFETTEMLLVENTRSLNKKIKSSPILYFFFTSMMLFSIIMFAFLTLFVMNTEAEISITDLFFTIFFIFTMKSAHDFYIFFIKSPEINYPLSTQINQKQTIFEIFLAVFLTELFIWFSLSALFLAFSQRFD